MLAATAWAYIGYPALLLARSRRIAGDPVSSALSEDCDLPTLTVIVAALNEAAVIDQKIADLRKQDYPHERLQIVVVADAVAARQIVEVEPPDLADLKPDVDPELRTIVARMMAKDRDLRVSSCAELIGGLEKYLTDRGESGNLVERVAAAAGGSTPAPDSTAAAELDSQPTRQVSSDAI